MNPPYFVRSGPVSWDDVPPSIRRHAASLGLTTPPPPAAAYRPPPDPADRKLPPAQPPDGRIRVGLLGPCLQMGGAESHQLALARHCDPARFAFVGCAAAHGEREVNPAMRKATEAFMPVGSGRRAAEELARRSDVLITWAIDDLPAILAAASRPPRVISVVHAPALDPWGQRVYADPRGIDRWVCVSELAEAAIPAPSRHVPTRIIWNCVDTGRMEVTRTRSAMRAAWGVPAEGARVALYLGRLSSEKDPHALRRAIDFLPDDWHAVLVGAGHERVAPHPRLHLVGADPRAGDCLNAADVLVVPSQYESFGLTLAEGLWSGVSVVSTEVGIAKLHPGMTHAIPVDADGPTVAMTIREANVRGPRPWGCAWARRNLGPGRFGREWGDQIAEVAALPAPTIPLDRSIELMRLRRECKFASKASGCGCADLVACSKNNRDMDRQACYQCLGG